MAEPSEFVRFQHVGLERKQVNAALQDHQGFLWLGTTDGLFRYDGYELRPYRRGTTPLSSNDIRALAEGAHGGLWIGSEGGGLNYLSPGGTVQTYRHDTQDPASLPSDTVSTLLLDPQKRLWIGTSKGLCRWASGSGTFVPIRAPEDLANVQVQTLAWANDDRLWIGTRHGLFGLNPGDNDAPDEAAATGINDNVLALLPEPSGRLWIGTTDGLALYDSETGKIIQRFRDELAGPNIRSILRDQRGVLWVGTENGLSSIARNDKISTFRHSPGDDLSLAHDRVYALLEDNSGLVWIATRSGIDMWNPRTLAFLHFRSDYADGWRFGHDRVRTITEDREKGLWIGTNEGLVRLDREARTWMVLRHDSLDPESLSNNVLNVSLTDTKDRLWFGTTGGLNLLRPPDKFQRAVHNPDDSKSLANADVTALYEDRSGDLWVGTWGGGLHRLQSRPGDGPLRFARVGAGQGLDPIGDNIILDIHEDANGTLWLAHNNTGLGRFDPKTREAHSYRYSGTTTSQSPNSETVTVIHGDTHGILWLGAWGGGLDRFDPATEIFRHYTEADGLVSSSIVGILGDDNGHLWISTEAGLSRFDPVAEVFETYDRSDGLQDNEFAFFAYWRSPSGELFFGGWNGLTAFRPENLEKNTHAPPVVLTSAKILRRNGERKEAQRVDGVIEMTYDDLSITFEAAALDFSAPQRNQYAYQVDDLSNAWIDLGTERRVTLPQLSPGDHTLRIRASNNHGTWNEEGISIPLRVRPPFWVTIWFQILLLLLVLGGIIGYFQLRERRIHKRSQALAMEIVRRQRVEVEREELIAALEDKTKELEMFSQTISHEVRSPLFTMQGFVGLLEQDVESGNVEKMQRDVEQIRNAADTIQRLLDELLNLWHYGQATDELEQISLNDLVREAVEAEKRRLEAGGVQITIDTDLPTVHGVRAHILEVFRLLIDNAAKYMGDNPNPKVHVGLRLDNDEPVVFVHDNGVGIPKRYQETVFKLFEQLDPATPGTGLGLALARRVIEIHGGRIWVESQGLGHGSTFCMTLPVAINFDEIDALLES